MEEFNIIWIKKSGIMSIQSNKENDLIFMEKVFTKEKMGEMISKYIKEKGE